MPLERLEDLALEVAPPIVHAARPLHGAGAEQQPCPPLAPGISGGCGGGAPGRAAAYGVEQVPAIVVEGARDYGIRFYGVPTGYEFGNLIDSIVVTSTGQTALAEETLATLRTLTADVDIKVFSTPT